MALNAAGPVAGVHRNRSDDILACPHREGRSVIRATDSIRARHESVRMSHWRSGSLPRRVRHGVADVEVGGGLGPASDFGGQKHAHAAVLGVADYVGSHVYRDGGRQVGRVQRPRQAVCHRGRTYRRVHHELLARPHLHVGPRHLHTDVVGLAVAVGVGGFEGHEYEPTSPARFARMWVKRRRQVEIRAACLARDLGGPSFSSRASSRGVGLGISPGR